MIRVAAFVLASCLALPSLAQKAEIFSTGSGAIDGHDPVAHFTEGRPVAGSPQFTHRWNGATWRFASAANRDRFAAAPEKYAPQYGGYCAYGVASGYAVKVDPDAWSVVDGKLYLNFNRSVQARWKSDVPGHVRKADANWPGVLSK